MMGMAAIASGRYSKTSTVMDKVREITVHFDIISGRRFYLCHFNRSVQKYPG